MGRNWRPKRDVVCSGCGWTGQRVTLARACPTCNHWHPEIVPDTEPSSADAAVPPPLHGSKTHALTPHAIDVLRRLARHGPEPTMSLNSGLINRFRRGGLTDVVQRVSPYVSHRGKTIDHEAINASGMSAIEVEKEPKP